MKIQFRTPYNRSPLQGEINSGELLVETAGYVSAQKRIESIMLAGQRLVEARREMFDYDADDDLEEDRYPVTRDPGFDLADASQITLDLQLKSRGRKDSQPDMADEVVSDNTAKEPSE